ncbi:MAG: N-acetyl-gamma-glutamyl-phosphate reductase [Defluviitaleaceae bacterium]|nr:N-acetyl-gamma-glutamyl-phosphate reductase [Defluviitaleaceae bacterium]
MKVFIDGQAGTTGLQLEERLKKRIDIQLLEIPDDLRKDPATRQQLIQAADVTFLCLPDDEARKSAAMAAPDKIVIDASTAHRTNPAWVYGLPELSNAHREKIKSAKRIAVPGCHAAGFISLVYPLVAAGVIARDEIIPCTSITGYSGGGKAMIADYETNRSPGDSLKAPRPYALGLTHKHLPEIQAACELTNPPIFMPVVGDFAQGMLVTIPIQLKNAKSEIHQILSSHYENSHFIKVASLASPQDDNLHMLDATANNGSNKMDIFVFGHDNQLLLVARHDNLGKGASGAAVQCMNIACGLDEGVGL